MVMWVPLKAAGSNLCTSIQTCHISTLFTLHSYNSTCEQWRNLSLFFFLVRRQPFAGIRVQESHVITVRKTSVTMARILQCVKLGASLLHI